MRTFSPSGLCATSSFFGSSGECSMKAVTWRGHAQDARRRAVVIHQRLHKARRGQRYRPRQRRRSARRKIVKLPNEAPRKR